MRKGLLRHARKTGAESGVPRKEIVVSSADSGHVSAPFALLRHARKTGAVLSAPPQGLASSFAVWRRASPPFALVILLPALLLAQDPNDKSVGAAAGKKQFQQTCGFCHGPDGRGSSGPDLIRSSILSHDVGGDLIGQVVRNGRPEKGMPAFQLPDSQIRNIAEFLHAEAKVAASVARRIPNEYPLEKLLVGDAAAGKTFFNGQGGCTACHSPSGDLAHVASKYTPFNLQTRIAFPEGIKPTVQVVDQEGNKFSGEQVYADEFLVSLRGKDGAIRTWKRTLAQIEITDPLAGHEKLLRIYTDKNIHDLFAYLETLK